jgi:hypothetical protein
VNEEKMLEKNFPKIQNGMSTPRLRASPRIEWFIRTMKVA